MTDLIVDGNQKAVVHASRSILPADMYNVMPENYTITLGEVHPAVDALKTGSIAVNDYVAETGWEARQGAVDRAVVRGGKAGGFSAKEASWPPGLLHEVVA
ncbi:MAG: hypothetical protein M1830_005703, partial [Pleopsidium flavum]